MALNAVSFLSAPDLKFTVFNDSSRGLPNPFGLLCPNGTGMTGMLLATAAAQNQMSSVVGAI